MTLVDLEVLIENDVSRAVPASGSCALQDEDLSEGQGKTPLKLPNGNGLDSVASSEPNILRLDGPLEDIHRRSLAKGRL